tara:strand:+ start:305 stop:991 length:687 start_codon:yes stop_codon:yes gene_type:complete
MPTKILAFDIETGPLAMDKLKTIMPEFKPPKNYKDTGAIAKNIIEQEKKWLANAALNPETGFVCAIGTKTKNDEVYLFAETIEQEKEILEKWWQIYKDGVSGGYKIAGWNNYNFDIPFLRKRSFLHNIKMPPAIVHLENIKETKIIDLMKLYNAPDFRKMSSLNEVSKFLLNDQKSESNGSEFYKILKTEKKRAEQYLQQDINLTYKIGEILTVGKTIAEYNSFGNQE